MEWTVMFSILVGILILLMAAGVPIAFCMGGAGFIGLLILAGPKVAINTVRVISFQSPQNFILLAVPLFILTAELLVWSGIGTRTYSGIAKVFSGIKGGLAYSTIALFTAMGAATGSSTAALGAIAPAAIKEMTDRGYRGWFSTGVIGGTGGLAIIIPPSIPMIIYGFVADVSVAKLFMAGVLPGLVMAANYMLTTWILVKINPKWAPASPSLPFKERMSALITLFPIIGLGLFLISIIYFGFTTPTEAAALGVFASLIIVIAHRKFSLSTALKALLSTARVTGFALIIVVGALIFGFLMTYTRATARLTEFTLSLNLSPLMLLIAVQILLLILGCLMDTISILLIVIPIVLPMLRANGMDPIWLGLLICQNMDIALSTPPVGMNLFVVTGLAKPFGITYSDVVKGNMPYVISALVSMVIVMAFPAIALWLPNKMGF